MCKYGIWLLWHSNFQKDHGASKIPKFWWSKLVIKLLKLLCITIFCINLHVSLLILFMLFSFCRCYYYHYYYQLSLLGLFPQVFIYRLESIRCWKKIRIKFWSFSSSFLKSDAKKHVATSYSVGIVVAIYSFLFFNLFCSIRKFQSENWLQQNTFVTLSLNFRHF